MPSNANVSASADIILIPLRVKFSLVLRQAFNLQNLLIIVVSSDHDQLNPK
jgi:hypothetical protein